MSSPNCLGWGVLHATLLFCLASGRTAEAQSQSLFGTRGPSGQIGSNLTGSTVGRSSTLGTTSGTGLGLSGQPLTGQSLGGQTAGTGMAGSLQPGTAGTQEGFVGRRGNAGRFVGNQLAGQQDFSAAGGRGFGGFGAGGQRGRAFGNAGRRFNQNQAGGAERTPIRPRQRIAFSYPQPDSSSIQQSLATRFERIAARQTGLSGVSVTVDEDGLAVLRGEVDSEETGRLAAIMARLEPGVRSIQNQLTVSQSDQQD